MMVGYQVIPNSSVATAISASGVPVIIYGVNIVGADAGTIVTFQDTASSASFQLNNVAAGSFATVLFSSGVTFSGGCTASSGSTGRITVFYTKAA